MPPESVFLIHLVLGYVPWLLCFAAYLWPRFKAMGPIGAQRTIAVLHSFRFFGLAFLIPGVVGPHLPAGFATFAAYGNFATGVLAMLALLAVGMRPLFFLFVLAFNLVGVADIAVDLYHAVEVDLPSAAGELGVMYAFPVLYAPLQIITHVAAFTLLARSQRSAASSLAGDAAAS